MRQYLPGLLALFLVAVLFRVDIFFTAVYFLLAVWLLTRLWMDRVSMRVQVSRHVAPRAFVGDEILVDVEIVNSDMLPVPWLEATESIPLDLMLEPPRPEVMSLGPHQRRHVGYRLLCRKRGYYALGPMRAEMGDLLDLQRRVMGWSSTDTVIVYPRVVALQQLILPTRSAEAALAMPQALFEDTSRPMGVRGYRRGDSPRRIHWPASARTRDLVVKQYQAAIARDTLVCLDFAADGYEPRQRIDAPELGVVAAASVASHIVTREGQPIGLLTEAWDPLGERLQRFLVPPRRETAQLTAILEVLARIRLADGAANFATLLHQECVRLPSGTTVIAITQCQTDALFDTLVYLQRRGLAVTLLVVHGGRRSSISPDRRRAGIPVRHVWDEREVTAWA